MQETPQIPHQSVRQDQDLVQMLLDGLLVAVAVAVSMLLVLVVDPEVHMPVAEKERMASQMQI